jgi:hypothetical protein
MRYLVPVNCDGFAIAAGYLGLCSLLPNPFTSTAAIVCGGLALRRVKRSQQSGHGRAWFGIIAGVVSLAVFALAVVVLATTPGGSTPSSSGGYSRVQGADSDATCTRIVHSLGTPPAMRRDADPIALMRSRQLPALPVAGFEHVQPDLPMGRYPDIDSYLRATPVLDPEWTRYMFQRDGYVVAAAAGFTRGDSLYAAEAIRFRDPAAADDYTRSDVLERCRHGIVSKLRRIAGTHGLSFVSGDGRMPHRAYLVIGDTAVHLNICSCVGADDLQKLAERWAREIERRSAERAQ